MKVLYNMRGMVTMVLVLLVSSLVIIAADKVFEEISNVPQDVTQVHLGPECSKAGHHTKAMFTIEPNTDDDTAAVRVSTYPANLVTAKKKGSGELRLEWNPDVAYGIKEGGVKIYLPSSQLQAVSVAADARAQILDGFTNVNSLSISSDASLYATFTTLDNSTSMSVSVSSDAKARVISNAPMNSVSASSDGHLILSAPTAKEVAASSDGVIAFKGSVLNNAKASSDAKVTVEGDMTAGKASSDGVLTIYGKVTGHVELSSDAKLYVGDELSGSVSARSDAKVYAPSCDTVSTKSDAKCSVDTNINGEVNVEVEIQSFTLTGTDHCWYGSAIEWWGWVLLAAGIGGGCFFLFGWCKQRNQKSDLAAYPAPGKLEDDQVAVAYTVDDVEKQHQGAPTEKEAIAYPLDPKEQEQAKHGEKKF